jgi:hypothetical protein
VLVGGAGAGDDGRLVGGLGERGGGPGEEEECYAGDKETHGYPYSPVTMTEGLQKGNIGG